MYDSLFSAWLPKREKLASALFQVGLVAGFWEDMVGIARHCVAPRRRSLIKSNDTDPCDPSDQEKPNNGCNEYFLPVFKNGSLFGCEGIDLMCDAASSQAVAAESIPLRILVAEDSLSARHVITAMLSTRGHEVVGVGDGVEAVHEFLRRRFDLVLLDVVMPRMDGFEATRKIKNISEERGEWVPVLIISSMDRQDSIVKGLSMGADDFIPKSWLMDILCAKIDGFAKSIQAYRRIRASEAKARDTVKRLADLNAVMRMELDIANRIMNRLVSNEKLSDPQVRYFLKPSDRFSGDVIAIARAHSGTLYAMLADATGHGLTAAISVLPAFWVFDGMVRKEATVPEIAAEINRRLKAMLPTGNFVAAHIVSVNSAARTMRIWSGGMPPAFWIDDDTNAIQSLESRHVALGILGGDSFDPSCRIVEWNSPGQCLLYSDGVSEAQVENGPMLGQDILMEAFLAGDPGSRLDSVVRRVEEHLSGNSTPDDMSILNILLDPQLQPF